MAFAAGKKTKDRSPLEPLASVTSLFLNLIVVGFIAAVIATLFGSGSILGWGRHASVCAQTHGIGGSTNAADAWFLHPKPGVNVGATGYRLCADSPTLSQRLWFTVENLPATLTVVGTVLAIFLLIRHAERHGLYAPGVAARLRFLGWFLVAAAVLRPTIETVALHQLMSSLSTDSAGYAPRIPWLPGLAGIAALSAARIMRVGTTMREDLEGVV